MEKYIIMSRYEMLGPNGKQMCDWFVRDGSPRSKESAEEKIKEIIKNFSYIDKKTKLNHEYMIKLKSDYDKERKDLLDKIDEGKKKQEEYYKSEEYKELQRKKRIAAKELKERQKKYKEEHEIK